MICRTRRNSQVLGVLAAVAGTSLFAPAMMAKEACEQQRAELLRRHADTPADEGSETHREFLVEQQYLTWNRSLSVTIESLSIKHSLTAFRTSDVENCRRNGRFECEHPRFDDNSASRVPFAEVWPHAPPRLA